MSEPLRVWAFQDGAACGYYRVRMPFAELSKHGHTAGHSCGWNDVAWEFPIILGQRVGKIEALPYWRRLRAGRKLFYETDDDLGTIDPTNIHAFMSHGPAEHQAMLDAIQIAHAVIVTTEHLAETLKPYHDNIIVINNHIDGALLKMERPRREQVTVGWAGGDSHYRDLSLMSHHLRRFFRRNPQVAFHTIGTDFRQICQLPGRWSPWERDIFDYYRLIDFDIGLAPLAETTFNRSKSHIKALEYAALGIPCIASDREPYRDFIIHGQTGYLVRDEHEWGKYLYALTHDQAMRDEMGAAAKKVAATWAIDDGYKKWEAAFRSL